MTIAGISAALIDGKIFTAIDSKGEPKCKKGISYFLLPFPFIFCALFVRQSYFCAPYHTIRYNKPNLQKWLQIVIYALL